jgi:hypothetical protein
MSVWVVLGREVNTHYPEGYGPWELLGVYSTREKAGYAMEMHLRTDPCAWLKIREMEVK